MDTLLRWNAGGWRWKVEGRALPMVFHLPPAPFHLSSGPVLRVLLRIGWGLRDYDRRRRSIANALKPMARSERAEGSGTEVIVELMASFAVVAAANPDNFRAPA